MTTNVQQLELIKATIDTQYTLARIELFRPFEIFDRYHGIKASEFPSHARDCGGQISFGSYSAGQYALAKAEWLSLIERAEPFEDLCRKVSDGQASQAVFQNVAACGCGQRVVVYSVRVSITWNGRTLMREYVLPDLERPTKEG